jgi:hypothetical protein
MFLSHVIYTVWSVCDRTYHTRCLVNKSCGSIAIAHDYINAKNPVSVYNANGFYSGNCLYREPSQTDSRSGIVWEIRPIRAQLAYPFVPYLYKKKGPTPHQHSPPQPPPSLLCLAASKKIGPAQSNDSEDWSPSATTTRRKVHLGHLDAHADPRGRWLASWSFYFILHMLDLVVCHAHSWFRLLLPWICTCLIFFYGRSCSWPNL